MRSRFAAQTVSLNLAITISGAQAGSKFLIQSARFSRHRPKTPLSDVISSLAALRSRMPAMRRV